MRKLRTLVAVATVVCAAGSANALTAFSGSGILSPVSFSGTVDVNNATDTLTITLDNTTAAPVGARISTFGFDTPTGFTITGMTSWSFGLDEYSAETNFPQIANNTDVGVCEKADCGPGGGGSGFFAADGIGTWVFSFTDGGKTFSDVDFFAGAGESPGFAVRFQAISGAGEVGSDVGLITTPVPEPETYALMLAGLAAVGFMARRRRQA